MFEGMNGSFGTDIPRDMGVYEPPRKQSIRDIFHESEMSLERKADIIAACFMGVLLVLTIVFSRELLIASIWLLLSIRGKSYPHIVCHCTYRNVYSVSYPTSFRKMVLKG